MERIETFKKLEQDYAVMIDEQIKLCKKEDGLTMHPTYRKWLETTQQIDLIWSYVESGKMTQSKAREMTAMVIEQHA